MSEKQCLEYCYNKGFDWNEDSVRLYDVLNRVSCWCCGNKNNKEIKSMYLHLPKYYNKNVELLEKIINKNKQGVVVEKAKEKIRKYEKIKS